jgi:hypothetical protein
MFWVCAIRWHKYLTRFLGEIFPKEERDRHSKHNIQREECKGLGTFHPHTTNFSPSIYKLLASSSVTHKVHMQQNLNCLKWFFTQKVKNQEADLLSNITWVAWCSITKDPG